MDEIVKYKNSDASQIPWFDSVRNDLIYMRMQGKVTLYELAKEMNVEVSFLEQWESGKIRFSMQKMREVRAALMEIMGKKYGRRKSIVRKLWEVITRAGFAAKRTASKP